MAVYRCQAVIDFAYGSRTTPLVRSIRARGGVAIEGREVLHHQTRRQFQVMTGAGVLGGAAARHGSAVLEPVGCGG